ncbi:MAG: hypothetical protein QW500_04265 [Candidatus Micrarchaeia archaeon]
MYEIKKVENEKGKIGKIKDVVKNKLNNLKPKNALKKIAAGGLIAASLFLSRPVMAEGIITTSIDDESQIKIINTGCSSIIDTDLSHSGSYSYLFGKGIYYMYTLPEEDKKVLQAVYSINEDTICVNKITSNNLYIFGEYVCEYSNVSIEIRHIEDILFKKPTHPSYKINLHDKSAQYSQVYVDSDNKDIIFVYFEKGCVKIIADNMYQKKPSSFEVSLNNENLTLYKKFIEDIKNGIGRDIEIRLEIINNMQKKCDDTPLECGGYKVITNIKIDDENMREEYLLNKTARGWNIIEYALNNQESKEEDDIEW